MNRFIALLTLVCCLMCGNLLAQGAFQPVKYEFPAIPDVNSIGSTSAPCPHEKLNFYDVSANGYGQWAVNSNWEWFLLTNDFPNDSLTVGNSSGCVARGLIPHDTNMHGWCTAKVQVVSNLRGSTRFVWESARADSSTPDGIYRFFSVAGLNDQDFPTGNLAQKQINISLPAGMNPVNQPAFKYQDVPAGVVVFPNSDMEKYGYKDIFRACMDAKYLYIVFATMDTSVYLTVEDLHGNIPVGYPKFIGKGLRPTVSCDVRNDPSAPTCDIAYIDSVASNGAVWYTFFKNGAIAKQLTLPQYFQWQSPDSLETWEPYDVPFHAKMLTGSVYDGTRTSKGIYIIFHDGEPNLNHQTDTTGHLIFHKITQDTVPDANAKYVDGWRLRTPTVATAWDVIDRPIEAIANPYDGESGNAYGEFHAIYRLREPIGGSQHQPPYVLPLRIVREDQVDTIVSKFDGNGNDPGGDTLMLDPNPQTMTLSVNQMGLHVRWEGINSTQKVYSRSMRYFDEPIEEHTLCANTVKIRDGLSHFGTRGATLLSKRVVGDDTLAGRIMTLYARHGTGVNPATGELGIYDNLSVFNIGVKTTSPVATEGATLIVLPHFNISTYQDDQEIHVNSASTFDYRGYVQGENEEYSIFDKNLSANDSMLFNFNGDSMIYGSSGTLPTFINPAKLLIRPFVWYDNSSEPTYNTQFVIPSWMLFRTNNTIIDLGYWMGTHTSSNAKLAVKKDAALNRTQILSHVGNNAKADTLFLSYKKLLADTIYVSNSPDTVATTFYVKSDSNDLSITESAFIGAKLLSVDPVGDFATITGNYFDKIPQNGIRMIRNAAASLNYDSIMVIGNLFRSAMGFANTQYIYLRGFSKAYDEVNGPDITLSNVFPDSTKNPVEAAIYLDNTTAAVAQNLIIGAGYQNGTVVNGLSLVSQSSAFLCSNSIQNCSISGINTRFWKGYVKLSRVSESGIAHISDEGDNGGIAFSKYFNCDGPAIQTVDPTSNLELRGVFNSSENYAFYDTLSNCNRDHNSGLIELAQYGHIRLGKIPNYNNYAHNNYIRAAGTDNFIYTPGDSAYADNIDSNYWNGYSPTFPDQYFPRVSFTRDGPVLPAFTRKPFTVYCGSGTDFGSKKGQQPQSFQVADTSCVIRLTNAESYFQSNSYQNAYHAYREYIENCPNDFQSWRGFYPMVTSNNERKPDTVGKNYEFREWLKKVLFYNTSDPFYYCEDVRAICASYLAFDRLDKSDVNAAFTVARYLIDSTNCDYLKPGLIEDLPRIRQMQYEIWEDSVNDPIATPFDTTSPTIDELDLAIIRKSQGAVLPDYEVAQSIVNLRANPNPFGNEVTIEYELSENTILNMEILDVLGREIFRTDRQLQSNGKQEFTFNTSSWSEGTYFARISTSRGEVGTVKLIKK